MGWDTLANGALIAAAEAAGVGAMITCDQNLAYQQNLSGRRIALVVLDTNHWDVVRADIDRVREAVGSVSVGAYIALSFERPVLRRRPYPGGRENRNGGSAAVGGTLLERHAAPSSRVSLRCECNTMGKIS